MRTIELTRKELYDIVWSKTLSKLTHQYAYTNDGIKKLCKQFEIPMPDGSYWSRLKFNKPVKHVFVVHLMFSGYFQEALLFVKAQLGFIQGGFASYQRFNSVGQFYKFFHDYSSIYI